MRADYLHFPLHAFSITCIFPFHESPECCLFLLVPFSIDMASNRGTCIWYRCRYRRSTPPNVSRRAICSTPLHLFPILVPSYVDEYSSFMPSFSSAKRGRNRSLWRR